MGSIVMRLNVGQFRTVLRRTAVLVVLGATVTIGVAAVCILVADYENARQRAGKATFVQWEMVYGRSAAGAWLERFGRPAARSEPTEDSPFSHREWAEQHPIIHYHTAMITDADIGVTRSILKERPEVDHGAPASEFQVWPHTIRTVVGWPLPAFEVRQEAKFYTCVVFSRLRHEQAWRSPIPLPGETTRLAAGRLLAPGFLLNTVLFAAGIATLVGSMKFVRTVVRRHRHQCGNCGYPIGASRLCSECGSRVRRRP